MYQDRSSDLDPRVSNVLNDGPKVLNALEETNDMLRSFYDIKHAKYVDCFHVGVRSKYTFETDPRDKMEWIDPNEYPEEWDYSKEYKKSLSKLNESVLDAYITFLEAEREALIQRWNGMARELKEEKL